MAAASSQSLSAAHQRAIRHWKQGHHVFHILLVTMNTEIESCLIAIQKHKWEEAVRVLHLLRLLFEAATHTMVYTADFQISLYESFIRPSMTTPFVSPGFSGLLNKEHALMLQAMHQLGTLLNQILGQQRENWPADLARAWSKLGLAQAYNRRKHALVCRKFVPDGDSLLRQFYQQQKQMKGD
jgi:hypothetical protein